jgi:hypothetical protein
MFSITLKRAAATLGVVAGLLAAAAPASAQSLPGMIGLKAGSSEGVKAPVPATCLVDFASGVCYFKAAGTETGNPERKRSLNASGGWDPTHELSTQGIAPHAVATAVVGGVVPGGAIVSA